MRTLRRRRHCNDAGSSGGDAATRGAVAVVLLAAEQRWRPEDIAAIGETSEQFADAEAAVESVDGGIERWQRMAAAVEHGQAASAAGDGAGFAEEFA